MKFARGDDSVHRSGAPHIRALTGMRFVAAFFVLFAHSQLLLGQSPLALRSAELTLGATGLTLFFCLSGFVLTWNYFDSLAARLSGAAVRAYALARVVRIYPLFLVMLAAGIGLDSRVTLRSLPVLGLHAILMQAWLPHYADVEGFLPVSWSLSVELFFYLTFPLTVLLISRVDRVKTRWLVAIAFALVALSAGEAGFAHIHGADALPFANTNSASRWLRFFPPARWPDFALGCVLARLHARGVRPPSLLTMVGLAATVLLWLSPVLTGHYDVATGANYSAFGWDAAWLPGIALALLWAAGPNKGALRRLLSSRQMVLLGGASYALYLLHQFVVLPISESQGLVTSVPTVPRVSVEFPLRLLGVWLLAIMCSIGFFLVVEEPARRFLRRLAQERGIALTPSSAELDMAASFPKQGSRTSE